MNANDEPKNAGTFPFARKWNSSVPSPANSSVSLTDRPVSTGTKMVAPNMANMCWMPRTNMRGRPSVVASYTAGGVSGAVREGAFSLMRDLSVWVQTFAL